jgi:hypothetical protein
LGDRARLPGKDVRLLTRLLFEGAEWGSTPTGAHLSGAVFEGWRATCFCVARHAIKLDKLPLETGQHAGFVAGDRISPYQKELLRSRRVPLKSSFAWGCIPFARSHPRPKQTPHPWEATENLSGEEEDSPLLPPFPGVGCPKRAYCPPRRPPHLSL